MRRILLLGALSYILILAGLGTMRGEFLLLALLLLLPVLSAYLTTPVDPALSVTRILDVDRVIEGAPVIVQLTITNHGRKLDQVWVDDQLPQPLIPQDHRHRALTTLDHGESQTWSYTLHPPRGAFDLDQVRLMVSDHLGIYHRVIELSSHQSLLCLPKVTPLRSIPIRPGATHGYAGPVPARIGGSGVDFFGIRQYQAGDPLRWINWRASARHAQALFTNEFEQERIADVGVILDARIRTNVQTSSGALFDHSVRAAASLADAFLKDGNRVGLLMYGGFLKWVFPGYGKVQQERIMRSLAEAETGESEVFDHLDYLPTRYFPPHSQIVLVSPLCREDSDVLVRLRARGYQVLVITPNPISFETRDLPNNAQVRLAERIARMEHAIIFRTLRQVGIQCVDWHTHQSLSQAMHTSLGRTSAWTNIKRVEP